MAMAPKGIDVRQTIGALLFRVLLTDSAGAVVTTGTTNIRIDELQGDGGLLGFDWADQQFKDTVLSVENESMIHRTSNGGTRNTGIWTLALLDIDDFKFGGIYFVYVENSNASPPLQVREIQFGNTEGDGLNSFADATLLRNWSEIDESPLHASQSSDTGEGEDVRNLLNAARALRNKHDFANGIVYKENDSDIAWQYTRNTDPSGEPTIAVNPTGGG